MHYFEGGFGMQDIQAEKIHEDARGRIFRIDVAGFEFYALETRKGYARGGHSHTEDSYIAVLKGKLEYRAKIGEEETVKTVKEGEIIFTGKDVPTILTALEDSLMIQWLKGPLVTVNYEPYRRIVREKLRKMGQLKSESENS